MSRQIAIVSHSHWDREWHQTFQQFRLRLLTLIDDLLDLPPDFAPFMLDGQTILLDDYTEIRQDRAAELRARIASGRLLIGPWYIQPDEFLVSGEAIVRNLLQGARHCRAWGAAPMPVGYIPDQFGHIAQLPQILRGFGIETAVLWRGVDRSVVGTAFRWESPDGSSVLAATLPYGYNQAERFPAGGQAAAERILALANALERLAPPGRPLLVMNGGDHVGVQTEIPAILRAAQEVIGNPYRLSHATLPEYLAALRAAGEPETVVRGELRNSRSAFLLPGVLSTRIGLKQRNAAVQTLLERQAEPLATVAAALGGPRRDAELRQSWRYLLQNQPHDSICGCGIDQVHREMTTRYDWSEQIGVAVRDGALADLAAQVQSVAPGAEDPRTLAITVFNGAPAAQGGRIDLRLHLTGEEHEYELVDIDGSPVPHTWMGAHGERATTIEVPLEEIPDAETLMAQIDGDRAMGFGIMAASLRTLGDALHAEVTIGDQALLDQAQIRQMVRDAFSLIEGAQCKRGVLTIHHSAEMHLAARVPAVPACGYRTVLLRPRVHGAPSPRQRRAPELVPVIENERYRIEADPGSGTLTIIDRPSGLHMGPANVLVDGGDAGDLYTYSSPAHDTLTTPLARPSIDRGMDPISQTLQIHYTLRVPKALTASRYERDSEHVDLLVDTTVTLSPGDPLIRFSTTVQNNAQDHRLRVHLALPFAADHAHAEDAFGLVRRAAQPDAAGEWAEAPVGTAPHQGTIAVHGAGAACVLAARGLPEYELLTRQDGTAELALTLLRCTGWLSRHDLPNRPGDAGPTLPTPEAQCPGTHTFAYALAFGAEPWRPMLAQARAFASDLCVHAGTCNAGKLPAAAPLVEISPAALVLSALKPADDGRGAILRLYNDDEQPHTATIRLLIPATQATIVTLAEMDGQVLFAGEPRTSFSVDVEPAKVVSIRLHWAP